MSSELLNSLFTVARSGLDDGVWQHRGKHVLLYDDLVAGS